MFSVTEIPGRIFDAPSLALHIMEDYGTTPGALTAVFDELAKGQHVILVTDIGDVLNIANHRFSF